MSVLQIYREGHLNQGQLYTEINNNVNMQATCIEIRSLGGGYYDVVFNQGLTAEESTLVQNLANEHNPADPEPSDFITLSDLDNKRLAVHASTKPLVENTVYVVFTGCGDDMSGEGGGGEMLEFCLEPGTPSKHIDVEFNPVHGRTWIHEAYLRFENGGHGDYLDAGIMAKPTNLQTVANLWLVVDDDGYVTSPQDLSQATHGFADYNVALLPRTFSMDGDWDLHPVQGLIPNYEGKGEYKISINEVMIHRYVHKVPCVGTCPTYFSLQSSEAAQIHPNYFLRVNAYNNSDTEWHASIFLEVYRERTIIP